MIVCHKHRFIYVRLPKTGSTSLAIALSRFCGPEDVITRISASDETIRRELGYPGPQNYLRPWYGYPLKDLLKVLVRRRRPGYKHPFASTVRRFVGEDTWNRYYKFCIERNPFDRAISRYYFDARNKRLPDINAYVCSLDRQTLSNWSRYTVNDRIAVDHVGRYEDLESELAALSARLGLPEIVLPRARAKGDYRQDRRHYSRILNGAARRRIEKVCAREIEMFSYQWTDLASRDTEPPTSGRIDAQTSSRTESDSAPSPAGR